MPCVFHCSLALGSAFACSALRLQADANGVRAQCLSALDQARLGLEAAINATAQACQAQIKEVAQMAENSARELAERIDSESEARAASDQVTTLALPFHRLPSALPLL